MTPPIPAPPVLNRSAVDCMISRLISLARTHAIPLPEWVHWTPAQFSEKRHDPSWQHHVNARTGMGLAAVADSHSRLRLIAVNLPLEKTPEGNRLKQFIFLPAGSEWPPETITEWHEGSQFETVVNYGPAPLHLTHLHRINPDLSLQPGLSGQITMAGIQPTESDSRKGHLTLQPGDSVTLPPLTSHRFVAPANQDLIFYVDTLIHTLPEKTVAFGTLPGTVPGTVRRTEIPLSVTLASPAERYVLQSDMAVIP